MSQLTISPQFQQFADFAREAVSRGDSKAIARQGGPSGTQGAMTITPTTEDKVGAIRRSEVNKTANDETRRLFKKAVADIFGGESKIPKSVLDAMNMKDFEKGKPLTARRILAVKTAIQNEETKMRFADMFISQASNRTLTKLTEPQRALAKPILTKYANEIYADTNVQHKHIVLDKFVGIVATDSKLSKHAESLLRLLMRSNGTEMEDFTAEDFHKLIEVFD